MTLEPKPEGNNNQPQPEPNQEPNPNAEWRNSPAAKQAFAEINALRKQNEDQKAAQKAAQAEAEQRKLAEQGKFEEIANKAQTDLAAAQSAHAAEVRRLKLEAGFAGITDEFARAGAIAKCEPDADIEAYISQTRENAPHLWGSPEAAPKIGANGQRSVEGGSGSGEITKETAQRWIKSEDSEKVAAARRFVKAHFDAHGKHPWA